MIKAVIDRFEEDKAVLLVGDLEEKLIIPKKFLRNDFQEGDYLIINIEFDVENTAAAKKEADDIMKKLI